MRLFTKKKADTNFVSIFLFDSLTCADDGGLGVAPQAVLENPGEFAVPVGDVLAPTTGQLLYDLAQGHQALDKDKVNPMRNEDMRSLCNNFYIVL